MSAARTSMLSYVAASILAAITLTTFYVLKGYGPEKAIARFRAATLSGDQREIILVTLQPPGSSSVQELEREVFETAQAPFEVLQVYRSPHEVVIPIEYGLPSGPRVIRWVVDENESTGWQINADKTLGREPWAGE